MPNTVIQHLGRIRFLYIRTLKQWWSTDLTPYPKKMIHLPSILSREEVDRLIEAAPTPFQRTLLMALYATGLRRAELARLKITDIDSARNVIHVQGGKGRKDRDVIRIHLRCPPQPEHVFKDGFGYLAGKIVEVHRTNVQRGLWIYWIRASVMARSTAALIP